VNLPSRMRRNVEALTWLAWVELERIGVAAAPACRKCEPSYRRPPSPEVGGDDAADALRYLVATKERRIVQRKLRGV
jgi:hypothetical protein